MYKYLGHLNKYRNYQHRGINKHINNINFIHMISNELHDTSQFFEKKMLNILKLEFKIKYFY